MKPIFLHIGMPKTGTSSIQSFLREKRQDLRERGIVVPKSLGRMNHTGLALYSLPDRSNETIRKAHGLAKLPSVLDFRKTLRAQLAQEAKDWNDNETIVLTSEHMSLLRTVDELERLKQLLALIGERPVRVVIYLRRQDLAYLSSYSQRVKNGNSLHWSDMAEVHDPAVWDYASLLDVWRSVHENIIVRVFERGQMVAADAVRDFLSVVGCADFPVADVPRTNESLDARTMEFLRRLNKYFPRFIDGRMNKQRSALVAALEQISDGPSLRMDRDAAVRFLAQYEEGNARVAREYLGRTDGQLFLDRPSGEAEHPPNLSLDDAIEISSKLWAIGQHIDLPAEPQSNGFGNFRPDRQLANEWL